MNTRIKIYGILLMFAYIGFFINVVYHDGKEIASSFMEGFNSHNDEEKGITTVYLSLKPVNGAQTVQNLIDGKDIQLTASEYSTKVRIPTSSIQTHLFIIQIIVIILASLLAIGVMGFPFLFFNIIYDISKNRIISDNSNIKIRILACILIGYSILEMLANFMNYRIALSTVSIPGYTVSLPNNDTSLIFLIVGIITLILAETIKTSLVIKEEQDLTI